MQLFNSFTGLNVMCVCNLATRRTRASSVDVELARFVNLNNYRLLLLRDSRQAAHCKVVWSAGLRVKKGATRHSMTECDHCLKTIPFILHREVNFSKVRISAGLHLGQSRLLPGRQIWIKISMHQPYLEAATWRWHLCGPLGWMLVRADSVGRAANCSKLSEHEVLLGETWERKRLPTWAGEGLQICSLPPQQMHLYSMIDRTCCIVLIVIFVSW